MRPKTIGEKIKKKRLDLDLYQKDVAQIIGVTTDTINLWENGRTKPHKENIQKIMRFLENQ
ncbi:MAG: helix-turn-helix transcriptional regulator [bacterium]